MKKIEKHEEKSKRQRYMKGLEKVSRKIFSMLKEGVSAKDFVSKVKALKEKMDKQEEVSLESNYHNGLKEYIDNICRRVERVEEYNEKEYKEMREEEKKELNRLQKIKNDKKYKRE